MRLRTLTQASALGVALEAGPLAPGMREELIRA
jgi:hypothetical protein